MFRLPSLPSIAALAAMLLPATACYDAEALIDERHAAANRMRLEEVDLGSYRITLPPAPNESTHGVVEFHAFGQVAKPYRDEVEKSLEQRGPELRHQMLLAVRQLKLEQIQEPKLTDLRGAVEKVVNLPLGEKLIERVGFYKFSFMPL